MDIYYFYLHLYFIVVFFFFKQKTAYEIKECDWSSDVCSSDLNRMMHLCKDMVNSIHKTLESGDYENLSNIKEMELLANKLNLFCRRTLNKQGYKDNTKITSSYRLNCLYEEITDYLRDICNEILKNNIKVNKKFVNLFKDLSELLTIAYSIHNRIDMKKHDMFDRKQEEFLKKINSYLETSTKKTIKLLIHMLKIEECLHNIEEELF